MQKYLHIKMRGLLGSRLVIFQANFSPNIFLLLTTLIKILMLTNANFVIKYSIFRDHKSEYIYQTKGIINKKPPP